MTLIGDKFISNKVDNNEDVNIQIIKAAGYSVKDMFDFINFSDEYKNYWINNVGNIPNAQDLYDISYSIYDLKIGYFTISQVWELTPKPTLHDLVKNYALIDILNYTSYVSLLNIMANLPSEKNVFNVTGLNLELQHIPDGYEIIGYELKDRFGDGWQGAEVYFDSVIKNVDENGVVTYTNDDIDDDKFNDQLFIPDKEDNYTPLDINYSYGAQNYFPFFNDTQYPSPTPQQMNITGLVMIKQGSYRIWSSKDFNNYDNEVEWNIIGQDGNIIVPEQVDDTPLYEGVEFNGYVTILKSGCTNSNAVNYSGPDIEMDNGTCFVKSYVNNGGIGTLYLDARNGGKSLQYKV